MKCGKMFKQFEFYVNDQSASQKEQQQFFSFIKSLKSSKRVRFVFRGNSNIIKYYDTDVDNIPLLSHCIFCIGDKGCYFLQKKLIDFKEIFPVIWNKFNDKVCKLNFRSEQTKQHVLHFLKCNPEIQQYFSNEQNRKSFECISDLPIEDRKKVADYYLSILHTIGKSANGKSFFLSASKNYMVADEFKGANSIIIYGWLPKKGINNHIIKYIDVEKSSSFVKKIGLPTCNVPIYPEQREICIKCGLLPNYIIGFQHDNKFYINPNILKTQWHDNIVYDGLDIDQKNFNDLLTKSKYSQSFIYYDGDYYLISVNGVNGV